MLSSNYAVDSDWHTSDAISDGAVPAYIQAAFSAQQPLKDAVADTDTYF